MFSVSFELRLMRAHGNDHENLYNPVSNRGDAGVDVYVPQRTVVPARSQVRIPLGVHASVLRKTVISFPNGSASTTLEPSSFLLLPRSSISKTPLRLSNSVGLIDSGYRGVIQAPVDNISDEDYIIEEGTRLFQIVNSSLETFKNIEIVDALGETERGEGGFGSTG